MKRVYPKLLKKLSIREIEEMRVYRRAGYSPQDIADKYGVCRTTAEWHTADLAKPEYKELT